MTLRSIVFYLHHAVGTQPFRDDVKPIVSVYDVESNAGSLGLRVEKARGFSMRPI